MSSGKWDSNGLSVVIPVFDEEAGIIPTLQDVRRTLDGSGIGYEILVIDDGSTDETAEKAASVTGVTVIRHKENRGVGAARKTGILASKYQAVVMLDGDTTYPAGPIPQMFADLAHYHMIVGARTGKKVSRNLARALPKWLILKLACYISGVKIPDLNSGLRAFRKSSAIRFFNILPEGHSWVSTITLAMLSNGLAVKFIPIDYHKRIGKSTFHPLVDTYNYILLIIRTVMYFNPLKVFFPPGAILLLAGIVKGIHGYVRWNDIRDSDILLIVVSLLIIFQGLLADLMVAQTKLKSRVEE